MSGCGIINLSRTPWVKEFENSPSHKIHTTPNNLILVFLFILACSYRRAQNICETWWAVRAWWAVMTTVGSHASWIPSKVRNRRPVCNDQCSVQQSVTAYLHTFERETYFCNMPMIPYLGSCILFELHDLAYCTSQITPISSRDAYLWNVNISFVTNVLKGTIYLHWIDYLCPMRWVWTVCCIH